MAVTVADIRARFSADTSDAERDVKKLGGSFTDLGKKAKDAGKEAGGGLAAIEKSLKSFGSSATAAGTTLSLALTAPLVGLGALAFSAGEKLNKGMANIASLGVASAHIKQLKSDIQDMQIQFGKSAEDLTAGAYQIVSAFGDTADTSKILAINTKLAAAGLATTSEAIALTSAVTKGYGDTSVAAIQHTSDLGLKIVELGQTTLPELASSIGMVTSMSNSLGIKQEEIAAGASALTGVIGTASQVFTGQRGVMQSLMAPTETMTKLMKSVGFANGEAMVKGLGWSKTLQVITAAAKKSGLPLQQFIGSIEGQNYAMTLTGPLLEKYTSDMKAMSDVTGKTDEAFKAQTEGANAAGFAMEQAKQKLQVFLERISDGMGPALLAFANLLDPVINKLLDLSKTFATLDPATQKWIVGLAAGAAAIGPVLLAVGALSRGLAVALPFLIRMIPAVRAITLAFGLLYGAYKLNIFGFKDLVNNGLKRIQAAAPLAGAALGELVDRIKYAGTNTFYTNDAIYKFTEALTGSKDIAASVSNTIVGLIGKIGNVQRAFNDAGGGVAGFAAAIGTLTGGTVTVDVKTKVTSIDWGNVLDFTLDLTNKFVKLTWNDVFDFTLDWKAGFTKFTWTDVFDFTLDWTAGFTKLTWGDVFDFTLDWTAGFTKLNWGDVFDFNLTWAANFTKLNFGDVFSFSLDWKTNIVKLAWGDVFDFTLDWKVTLTKLTWSDVFSFVETLDLKVKQFTFSEVFAFTLEWAPTVVKLTWSDVFDFSLTSLGFKPMKLTWNDVFDFTLSNLAISATKLTWDDVFAFSKTITLINAKLFPWTDVFGFSQVLDLTLLKKITWSDVFDFTTNLALALSPPTIAGVTIGEYIGGQLKGTFSWPALPDLSTLKWPTLPDWKWPDYTTWAWPAYLAFAWPLLPVFTWPTLPTFSWPTLPTFSWPTLPAFTWPTVTWPSLPTFSWPSLPSWTWSALPAFAWPALPAWAWPTLPSFSWPSLPTWSWPSLPTWTWPALPTWSWPTLPTWTWPSIPTPGWLSSLLNWRPSFFGGGAAQGPPAPAKGDPEVFFGNAAGTSNFAGGWTWVGERGAELMKLPRGTQIASHENSMKMIGHMADGNFTAKPPLLMPTAGKAISAPFINVKGNDKILAEMVASHNQLVDISKSSYVGPQNIIQSQDKNAQRLVQVTESFLQSVPGLFKTSPVTQQQMDLAKLGVPQNFADDWIRQLTDTVVNGVHWDGVDIKDAAARAGLDPGLPAKAILEMVTQKWNDQSLFADKKNLDLINMDAIKQAMAQQAASKLGQQNIFALFGIKPDEAQGQAVSLGNTVGTGVQQGLTNTLSKASSKDDKGIDMGSGLVNALKASLTDSTAFDTVGPAILKKIADSWKTINTDVDFVGGLAAAFDVQLSTKNAIESFQAIGGKIAKILKQGIDEYFKNAAIADAIAKSIKPTAPKSGIPASEIPKNALGTSYWRGGLSWVGERGAELVNLPRGAQVIPHNRSMQLAGGNTYNVTVNAVLDNQIDVHDLAYRMVSILKRKGG